MSPLQADETRAPEGVNGLAKGLAIIEALGAGGVPLTIAEAARAAGVSRASARRCLLTLVELGFLAHDGKFFRPLPRLLRLGAAYLHAASLPALAAPVLAAARDELGESVSLAILDDGWSVFIARAEAVRIVSTGVRVGARLPAYCSATGRILLGTLARADLRAYLQRATLEPRTPRTLVDAQAICAAVEMAQAQGVAFSDEELELGMRAMAVPVRDSQGRVRAAMSVSVSSARVSLDAMGERFLPVLRRYAGMLDHCEP